MPSAVSPPQLWTRGPPNELHFAARDGALEHIVALLSRRSFDLDQGNELGCSPLMIASFNGHQRVARLLLTKGANLSVVDDSGCTALHYSAQGNLAITKMLVEAGADLEAATDKGHTPLSLAAGRGKSEVMAALIEAGANPNSSSLNGETPLYMAAWEGHLDALKVLLRAKANPLLAMNDPEPGAPVAPLDVAAQKGHSAVVRELVQQVGIEGCGGASGGIAALGLAVANQHVDIMATLTEAGVVDTGTALVQAAACGREASVKFLLQQKEETNGRRTAYVNFQESCGFNAILMATGFVGLSPPSPRIARLLIDAGADTRPRIGGSSIDATPLELTTRMLRSKKNDMDGKDFTEDSLLKLKGVRRLLLRVEAVHAVSWLWPVGLPSIASTAAESSARMVPTSTSLTRMLPLLRRRARRPRVLLAALRRNSEKP